MLNFDNLSILFKHQSKTKNILPTQDVFMVGGVIRDLLLSTNLYPTDIDMTGPGDPDTYRESSSVRGEKNSRFRTEKYGTMSFIPNESDTNVSEDRSHNSHEKLTYELTPFRTESNYSDNRHPDEIIRSSDLLLDAARRDFTINAMYWIGFETSGTSSTINTTLQQYSISNTEEKHQSKLKDILKKNDRYIVIGEDPRHATLVMKDHIYIQKILNKGNLDKDTVHQILLDTPICISREGKPSLIQHTADIYTSLQQSIQAEISNWSILIDPYAGVADLLDGYIRTVGKPNDRFQEDALRMIRALRFVNIINQKLPSSNKQNSNFDIQKETWKSIVENADLIKHIAKERYHQELMKVCTGKNLFGFVCLLRETGLLSYIFEELPATIDNIQPIRYHPFDTYNHTLLTLHALQTQLDKNSPTNALPGGLDTHSRALVYLAMLYHDIGKPEQYEAFQQELEKNPDDPDRSAYVYHTESGADIAKKAFTRLCFAKKDIAQISWYIKMHHRPGEILDSNPKNRLKKIRALFSEGGLLPSLRLLDIAISDRIGQYNPLQQPAIQELIDMQHTIIELNQQEGRFTRDQLAINGNDLITHRNITPGPIIGTYLDKAFEWVMTDVSTRNTPEQIQGYLQGIIEN